MLVYQNLQIKLPFEVINIHKINLIQKINRHHILELEAFIEEKNAESYLEESSDQCKIQVLIENEVIYVGKLIEAEVVYRYDAVILKLKAISYSYDLDIKRKTRVFQSLGQTYDDIIKEVISTYPHKDYIYTLKTNPTIPHLLVQYQETDWEFIKRLATHFKTVLTVDSKAPSPRFYFGKPSFYKEEKLSTHFGEAIADFESFRKIKALSKGEVYQQNFIGWQVEGPKYLALGTRLIYEGQKVMISSIEMFNKKEEIVYRYTLQMLEGIKTAYIFNSKLKGVSLEAIVKKRQDNQMQLHFCINQEDKQREDNQWFYYGREVGNFYCMPVEGSKVHITFLTGDESKVNVTQAIRSATKNDKYYSKTIKPDFKSYTTIDGQELLMTPDSIQIAQNKDKSIQISLTKDGDVSISAKNVHLNAKKDLKIGNEKPYHSKKNPLKVKRINLSAQNKVIITRNAENKTSTCHSITLNEQNHLKGIIQIH